MTGDEEDEGNDLDDLLLANDESKQEYNLNSIESRSLYFPSQERDHLKTYNSASSSYSPQEPEEKDSLKTYNSASLLYFPQEPEEKDPLKTYNSASLSYFPQEPEEKNPLKTYNSASSSYFPQEPDEKDRLKTYNSASSSYKVQQATLETYNSVDICNKLLSKLQEKYGCLFGQVNINISNFSKPVEDIFEFIRKATNIDLLKQPIFLIDDKE